MSQADQKASDHRSTKTWLSSELFKPRVLAAMTAIKLLLVPSYRSTDFEACKSPPIADMIPQKPRLAMSKRISVTCFTEYGEQNLSLLEKYSPHRCIGIG